MIIISTRGAYSTGVATGAPISTGQYTPTAADKVHMPTYSTNIEGRDPVALRI